MSRHDLEPQDRDQQPLVLSQLHDCVNPLCDEVIEVDFTAPDGVFDAEDLTEAPKTVVLCPKCGRVQDVEYTGWTVHDES